MAALPSILFGGLLTLVTAYAIGSAALRKLAPPPEIALATGAALLSVLIFLVVLAGAAGWPAFLALGLIGSASGLAAGRCKLLPPRPRYLALLFLPYALWYFVNALAPETLPDGLSYHLGLPYEYIRLGGFPSRIAFFDAVPQGMEMLYTMAFAFGRHSAARLVEFAFLLATPVLMLRIGRRLGMSDLASLVAAVFYFTAPVAGVTGSSSYTDAAMVFFTLAAFYALLTWRDTGTTLWLLPAGLAAGFCYSIKITGAVVVVAGALFVILQRRGVLRPLLLLATSAALVMSPWLVRNWVLTGDPLAPLGNALFPNPYFHLLTEKELGAALSSYGRVTPLRIPWELAFGDGFTGTFGPLLFFLPLGLLALRTRTGRLCLAAALILALPWFSNRGARFLMPAVAMAAFPMAMVLPRRAAWAAIAVQAVVCWPQVLNLWQPDWIFRLHDFPLRAALRIQPEPDYLGRHSPEYPIARMLEDATRPGTRILSFDTVANAYLARDVTVSWQSAEGDRLSDTLRMATVFRDPTYKWSATWPTVSLRALRFRLPAAFAAEWDICDIELADGEDHISPSPQWSLRAWPDIWETPAALDGNRATRWRTWQPMRAGMFFEIDFDRPLTLASAALTSHTPRFNVELDFYGQTLDGRWQLLSAAPSATLLPDEDLRLQATSALRHAGFQYLLVPTGEQGNGAIGRLIEADPLAWDMEKVGQYGDQAVFRVR